MRMRGMVAATAGVCAAASAHALDVTGRLPMVHEAAGVRTAMSPGQVVLWLVAAAIVSAVAATTRVVLVGVPGALLISAAPELIGRGDLGAIVEPGAILGAIVQVLLLLLVVGIALVLQRWVAPLRPQQLVRPVIAVRPAPPLPVVRRLVDRIAAPRGPPLCVQSKT